MMLSVVEIPEEAGSSRGSSYHSVHDQSPGASSGPSSVTHSQGTTEASSPPSSPELMYDTTTTQRHGKALVIEQPTLVNFVPTSDIQTAVSITADRIIIDTILPPTATLRANQLAYRPSTHAAKKDLGAAGLHAAGFSASELLKKHEEEVQKILTARLTETYDPTGTIKDDIVTTLTQITRFPDPIGTNRSTGAKGKCPCICCELGCNYPLEPYQAATSGISATHPSVQHTRAASVDQPRSFLDMSEPRPSMSQGFRPSWMRGFKEGNRADVEGKSRTKSRFGFFTFGRSGRSRSHVDLSRDYAAQGNQTTAREGRTAIPAPIPPIPSKVTDQVVPPQTQPPRSRSFSDLVRRRRNRHMATASLDSALPASRSAASVDLDRGNVRQSLDVYAAHQPSQLASQLDATDRTKAAPTAGRFSLDSARPGVTFTGPQAPPRRSSKLYAIMYPKTSPPTNASSNTPATLPRSGTAEFVIGRIVEEEEGEELIARINAAKSRDTVARRQ